MEGSLVYHKNALEHFEETRGQNDHRTADMSFKVAEHYFYLRDMASALYELFSSLHNYTCLLTKEGHS